MKVSAKSFDWALSHLIEQGDSDLFPLMLEFEAFKHCWLQLRPVLEDLDIEAYHWLGTRRFVVPKDTHTFRIATQLHPLDSLILAAIVHEVGPRIEANRIADAKNIVFSYRFLPNSEGRFYAQTNAWESFWDESISRSQKCKFVAVSDITDYYNQIYHHEVENQLKAASVPKEAVHAIIAMLKVMTDSVSRGVPVGPHSIHLIAECALNSIDHSLLSNDRNFCRFVDDIHFFCDSREEAQLALFDFAETLDRHQRLTVQKQKTMIYSAEEFAAHAKKMREDQMINDNEGVLLNAIKRQSKGDPYGSVQVAKLKASEQSVLKKEAIEEIFNKYLAEKTINYQRIGWLFRRLAQTGSPEALGFAITHLSDLLPVIGNLARYVMSASPNYQQAQGNLGTELIKGLDIPLVNRSEYLQMILLDLFSRRPDFNHIEKLTSKYATAQRAAKREIVKAAGAAKNAAWIKERKNEFRDGDRWLRPVLIWASQCLPGDEGKFWIKSIGADMSLVEKTVARWAYGEQMKSDEISVADLIAR